MTSLADLRIRIFADGADLRQIEELAANPLIRGFTTNPTLMRKAGVTDYKAFAKDAIRIVGDRPISFEVFADDFPGMERQARIISEWGENVYVKIPITNTKGEFVGPVLQSLSAGGVKVNVTAIMTEDQMAWAAWNLLSEAPAVLSYFAGRVANTGRRPIASIARRPNIECLWASPRELLNIWDADEAGFDIITVTPDILANLKLVGKDLDQYSLETVRMFYDDAQKAGYKIEEDALV